VASKISSEEEIYDPKILKKDASFSHLLTRRKRTKYYKGKQKWISKNSRTEEEDKIHPTLASTLNGLLKVNSSKFNKLRNRYNA